MKSATNESKRKIVMIGVVVILAMAVFVCWAAFRPSMLRTVKEITVTVLHGDGTTSETTFRTLEDTLGDVLMEDGFIEIETYEPNTSQYNPGYDPYEYNTELSDSEDSESDTPESNTYISVADGEACDISQGQIWLYMIGGKAPEEYDVMTQKIADQDIITLYLYVVNTD